MAKKNSESRKRKKQVFEDEWIEADQADSYVAEHFSTEDAKPSVEPATHLTSDLSCIEIVEEDDHDGDCDMTVNQRAAQKLREQFQSEEKSSLQPENDTPKCSQIDLKSPTSSAVLRNFTIEQDAQTSINEMIRQEKFISSDDILRPHMKYSKRTLNELGKYMDIGAKFVSSNKNETSKRSNLFDSIMDSCRYCNEGRQYDENLVLEGSEHASIMVPPFEPLKSDVVLIVPKAHVTSLTRCERETLECINKLKKRVFQVFETRNMYTIFTELLHKRDSYEHMTIMCFPTPMSMSALSKMYFKKAIMECDSKWAENTKLLTSKNYGAYKSVIPKNLPYFAVEFGLTDESFAHIIEDQHLFPTYFAEEVLGGMFDIDADRWLGKSKKSTALQRARALSKLFCVTN